MTEKADYDKTSTPSAHKTSHQDGGSDEISVAALSGQLADPQSSTWALVTGKPTTFPPESHVLDGSTYHSVPTDNTNFDVTTLVHGLMPKLDKAKLDGIEAGATKYPDTGEEVYSSTEKTKLTGIEAGATKYPDTGEQAFLDADHTKLDGIEAGATKYPDTGEEVYSSTEKTKLTGIEAGATKYPDTGEQAFLDADHTKLDGIEAGASPGEGHITIIPANYSAITQGTWIIYVNNLVLYNGSTYNESNAQNDQIDFKAFLAAGTYTFVMIGITNPAYAVGTLLFDEVSQGTSDWYSAATVYNVIKRITGIVVSTSGIKTISLKAATRNGLSSGWLLAISSLALFRTA